MNCTGRRDCQCGRGYHANPLTSQTREHFPGCHPEDEHDQREVPKGYQPAEIENCWHCNTPTPRGCHCWDCLEGGDYVPPTAIYHCPACKRWWAWMTGLNITTITFGAEGTTS